MIARFGLICGLLLANSTAYAECDDPQNPQAQEDCDGDGFTGEQGDCDDTDASVSPDADEICGDDVDNNCDDIVDEDCDDGRQHGDAMGGSSCGQSGGGLSFLVPLLLIGRRKK